MAWTTFNTGSLDFAQLKTLLTDLTDPGNAPPTDEEVYKVLYEADRKDGEMDGVVKKVELLYAISIWYTMVRVMRRDTTPVWSLFLLLSLSFTFAPQSRRRAFPKQ